MHGICVIQAIITISLSLYIYPDVCCVCVCVFFFTFCFRHFSLPSYFVFCVYMCSVHLIRHIKYNQTESKMCKMAWTTTKNTAESHSLPHTNQPNRRGIKFKMEKFLWNRLCVAVYVIFEMNDVLSCRNPLHLPRHSFDLSFHLRC